MIRKLFCSMVAMVVGVTIVAAADVNGVINKVEGNKVTFQEMTKAKKGAKAEKVGDEKVYTIDEKVKIVTTKFDKDAKKFVEGDEVKDGLKNEIFTKLDAEKGVGVTLSVEDGKVSKIAVRGGKKKAAN